MPPSIRLCRIAGIPISANWSLIALMALLVFDLANGAFPASDPGLASGLYLLMGLIAAVSFVLGILLHEMGHAIQARREGMTIHDITLWLFGGVARFEGFFPSGAAEVRIALAGPAVSLVLGGSLYGVSQIPSLPLAVATVVWWLAIINLILGVFNMLPALPLDGGRTLRGTLWAFTRNLERATRIAAQVSRAIAIGLIVVGIILVAQFGDVLGGIWLAMIGVFVMQAAAFEGRAGTATARASAHDVRRIRDVMRPFTASVTPETPIATLTTAAAQAPTGTAYPVVDRGDVIGLLVREALLAVPSERVADAHARDLMIRRADLTFVDPNTPVASAEQTIADDRWRQALVLDDNILVGIVALADLGGGIAV